MSFWDVFWLIVVSFLFVAYLTVLFSIITDLFRDRELGGWAKAAWLVALIVVPLLTSLVYVIARGDGMAERAMAADVRRQEVQADYIRSVAGGQSSAVGTSPVEQIQQAKALLDAGAITDGEFVALKEKALRGEAVAA